MKQLIDQARELLSVYTDAEILVSQTRTTPDEGEILDRLDEVVKHLTYINGKHDRARSLSAVVAVLRERRYAKHFANKSAFGGAYWTAKPSNL